MKRNTEAGGGSSPLSGSRKIVPSWRRTDGQNETTILVKCLCFYKSLYMFTYI